MLAALCPASHSLQLILIKQPYIPVEAKREAAGKNFRRSSEKRMCEGDVSFYPASWPSGT